MDERGLGQRIQALRMQAGLTQQALCQKADLSYSTLTKIERGAIKSPSIFTIQSIGGALNVGLDELLGIRPPATKSAAATTKHTSQSGIKFVYFDINGCLVRFFHRAFTRLSAETGASADIVETTFWHYNDQVCRGDMPIGAFDEAMAKALSVPKIDWMRYYLEAIEPIGPMTEMVRWAAENYHIGLLTNIMPGFVAAMREQGLLPDIPYEVIIDSSEVHAIKPEAKIYAIATERSHHAPHEILLVDDARPNLMAAERHGWHVLWFDDYRPEESIARIRTSLEVAA